MAGPFVRSRFFGVLLVVASAAACSDTGCPTMAACAATQATADSLLGTWNEVQVWDGISLHLSLQSENTMLSGSATYTTTDGSRGTATVLGHVFWEGGGNTPGGPAPARPGFVMDLRLSDGRSVHYDQGILEKPGTISGVLWVSDSAYLSYGTTFVRTAR